jgi:hypothetical protein
VNANTVRRHPLVDHRDFAEILETSILAQCPSEEIEVSREISDTLLEHGQAPLQDLIIALEIICERQVFERAKELLRDKLQASETPQANAVRTLLLGKTESSRAEAKRLGVSHSQILRARRKAKKMFQDRSKIKL